MLAEIEEAIINRLETKGLPVRDLDISSKKDALRNPATYVHIESGKFSKITMTKYKLDVSIFLTIIFKNLRDEKQRRLGIYPILISIFNFLSFQNLDLEDEDGAPQIDPLKPMGFQNITNEDDARRREIIFQMEFKTGYEVGYVDDETYEDLLTVGLKYYLQDPEDDDVEDAEDIISL